MNDPRPDAEDTAEKGFEAMDARWMSIRFPDHSPSITATSDVSCRLQGLILDVRGVLYDDSPWCRWLLQLLHRIGLHSHFDVFYHVWEKEFLDDVASGKRDYWDAMREYLRAAGLSPAQVTEVEAAGKAKRHELENNVRLLPGVRKTLQVLAAQGIQLAVSSATPWPTACVTNRLESLRIREFFCAVGTTNDGSGIRTGRQCIGGLVSQMAIDRVGCALVTTDPIILEAAVRIGLHTIVLGQPDEIVAEYHIGRIEELRGLPFCSSLRRLAG